MFRLLVPPFIDVEVIPPDTLEHDDLTEHFAMFDSGQNFPTNVNNYASVLIDDLAG